MNQKNLLSIIILDIIVMALALGLIIFRYSSLTETSPLPLRPVPAGVPAASVPPVTAPANTVPSSLEADVTENLEPANELPRNIGFQFRHSKARKVEVVGDFNGWVPKPMVKGKDYRWTVTLAIPAGEYAYNFVVDGKPIRDPNNPKICDVGRGFPNSLLKVKSLTDEKKQSE